MKIYIIVEKGTDRFVSAHETEYDAVQFYIENLSEFSVEYDIKEEYTI